MMQTGPYDVSFWNHKSESSTPHISYHDNESVTNKDPYFIAYSFSWFIYSDKSKIKDAIYITLRINTKNKLNKKKYLHVN